MSEKDIDKKEINNRREFFKLLEQNIMDTYEREKEYQYLIKDLNMVKSYLVESHDSIKRLDIEGYDVNVEETNDSTFFIVKFRKNGFENIKRLYVDTMDERFWTIHTVAKSGSVDPFINKLAKKTLKKDHVWFPVQYLERFKKMGESRSITLKYSEILGDEEEELISDLSMKLWGGASSDVYSLINQLPELKSLLEKTDDTKWIDILNVCESLSHSSPLSGIGVKIFADEHENIEERNFILEEVNYNGKFTARGGNSISEHLYLLRKTKEQYSDVIQFIEDEISIQFKKSSPLGITGHPLTIILTRPIQDLGKFTGEVISCKEPFRIWGLTRDRSEDYVGITGVDLHNGDKINLEVYEDWIRLYLPKGGCGNTIARFYSLIQHNYDSNAVLEGVEHGQLF